MYENSSNEAIGFNALLRENTSKKNETATVCGGSLILTDTNLLAPTWYGFISFRSCNTNERSGRN